MFEKVNPMHVDKIADRIAGAIVDIAYSIEKDPRVAVECLIGHGHCYIIVESSVNFNTDVIFERVYKIVERRDILIVFISVKQDRHLSDNQASGFKCGDNGIFKGTPISNEEKKLTVIAKNIYNSFKTDGKYIIDNEKLIICQSNVTEEQIKALYPNAIVNPLGEWTGGIDVDTGAVNRKLGSDMGKAVTGGGLFGKDLSKADVSVNIWCFLKAQELNKEVSAVCAIGDSEVQYYIDKKKHIIPFKECVKTAREYIKRLGGFEKFAQWGLVR